MTSLRSLLILLFASWLLLSVAACSEPPVAPVEAPAPLPGDAPSGPPAPRLYTVPADLDDGWSVAHAEDHGFDMALLEAMIQGFREGAFENMHAMVVIKDGLLVVDEYHAGTTVNGEFVNFTASTLHSTHSVAKSVNSVLVGIALKEGLIESVDVPLVSFFDDYVDPDEAEGRERILLRHALSMTAGLDWDEWNAPYGSTENDHYVMDNAPHPVQYVVTREALAEPGSVFVYNSGLSITLGEIIHRVSGVSVSTFSNRLFSRLRIDEFFWWTYPDGTVHTGGGLRLRPRDMAKIGELYRRGGAWNGEQIVDPDWVQQSSQPHAPGGFYGYQWWIRDHQVGNQTIRSFRADGLGGQYIFVVEALDLVVVFTQGNPNQKALQAFDILEAYLMAPLLD